MKGKRPVSALLAVTMFFMSSGASALPVPVLALEDGDGEEIYTLGTSLNDVVSIDESSFPDKTFRSYVSEHFDTDKSGGLSQEEMDAVTIIGVSGMEGQWGTVSDLTGIGYFKNLTTLNFQFNKVSDIDLSGNTALVDLVCDHNKFTELDVSANTKLELLWCGENSLTGLDVSKNTALNKLVCPNNQITALDVSSNKVLEHLNCGNNKLTELDVKNNPALKDLICSSNQITALDVSLNPALEWLDCGLNRLTSLDVKSNPALTTLFCYANSFNIGKVIDSYSLESFPAGFDPKRVSNLIGAEYDSESNSLINFTGNIVTYDYDCGNGKTASFTLTVDSFSQTDIVLINEETFPDETFRNYISDNFDTDNSGGLSKSEIGAVICIDVSGTYVDHNNVSDLSGIEFFPSLEILSCSYTQLASIDVSKNSALKSLFCSNNQLTVLDLSKNTALECLDCSFNQFTSIDVSSNTKLLSLYCSGNQLTDLDLRNNTALSDLSCMFTQLTSLDVSNNSALKYLNCGNNQLTSLNVSSNTELLSLNCSSNQLTALDVKNNTALETLEFSFNQVTGIDLSNNSALTTLGCGCNQLESLDVSNNPVLKEMYCSYNQITSLDVRKNPELTALNCGNNRLTSLDLSNNPDLTAPAFDDCSFTVITADDFFSLDKLPAGFDPHKASDWQGAAYDKDTNSLINISSETVTYNYDCGNGNTASFKLIIALPDVDINEENFPDETFRNYVSDNFDTDKNGKLSDAEIKAVAYIGISGSQYNWGTVSDLTGIGYFKNLTFLNFQFNKVSDIDLSKNTALQTLICDHNKFTELDISANTKLELLWCGENSLTALDVSNNTALDQLVCPNNQLTKLDVGNNTLLDHFNCGNNKLTDLDVKNNPVLKELICPGNQLTVLDVSLNPALEWLDCGNNQLTSLDLSNNSALTTLYCNCSSFDIGKVSGSFSLDKLPAGFDPKKASNWQGAEYDSESNSLINFTSDTVIYNYDCGNGRRITFTLVKTGGNSMDITKQPADTTVIEGLDVSLSVTAEGEGLTYCWQKLTGESWVDISGGDSSVLALSNVTYDMNGTAYRCVIGDGSGSVTSETAVITVKAAEVVTVSEVESLSIDDAVKFVNAFCARYDKSGKDTAVLTEAQLRAVERVLEHDYKA